MEVVVAAGIAVVVGVAAAVAGAVADTSPLGCPGCTSAEAGAAAAAHLCSDQSGASWTV